MGFQTPTIRTRLLLLSLVLIIPFTVLGFVNLWDFWNTNRNYLNQSLEQQANLASKAFEQHLLAQRQPLIMLSTLMARGENNFTIQDYLDSAVKTRPEWLDLQILDNKGESIFKQNVKKSDVNNNSVKQLKGEADRENKFTVESVESDGKKKLTLAMPLSEQNTAVAQIDGVSIKDMFDNLNMPEENIIIVIDKNKNLIYQNHQLPEGFPNTETIDSIMSHFKRTDMESGTIEIKNSSDDINRVYGLSKIGLADAIVAVGKPTSSLYEPARRKFIRLAVISLLLTILAVTLAFFITRGITQPMKRVTEIVRRFGSGEKSVRTDDLPDGTIGELGSTFNKMAEEIVERQKELEKLDRLKSSFVDSVSHELRTPLTTIKTLTHVLRSDKISASERKEYLQTIAVECDRQIEFVQTLLNLSRIESGAYKINLKPTDVIGSIRKCVKTHKRTAETRNLSLIFEPPTENLPLAQTDNEALCLVISGLIENALKYTPAAGKINISAKETREKIAISITDNGYGIAENDIPHIFKKFYRGNPLENSDINKNKDAEQIFGIGLGLYVVKSLVKDINAEIRVKSPVKDTDNGTKFTLLLPKSAD